MAAILHLFGKKKSPEAAVASVSRHLAELRAAPSQAAMDKINVDLEKSIDVVKELVYGVPEDKVEPEPLVVHAVAEAFEAQEVMPLAVSQLRHISFEVRKSFVMLFVTFLRNDSAGWATVYLRSHPSILLQLVDGYNYGDIALNCGTMVRECIKLPVLHEALLYGPDGGLSKPLCDLFEYHVNNPNFEVSSDAFETLSCMLTSNKPLVFKCLNPNEDAASLARYNELFGMYNKMLQSDSYVLRQQSLKLLSEFLLDRENFAIMMRYIVDKNNLRIVMTLLRHKTANIQFEAFHVFKVFVANPEKPADIVTILAMNKARLIAFLRAFQNEKDDEQFIEEKAMLIDTLQRLPDMEPPAPAATPDSGSAAS